jgi:hypothetical protein
VDGMKQRKKVKLSYSKERVLFSDVLPYECPIIFSNRYFYRFLAKYLWIGELGSHKKTILIQTKRKEEIDAQTFAALLFGCYEKGKPIGELKHMDKELFYPYQFNIAHKPNKNRTLSIIHPYNQWQVVNFYEKYKYSILYLCNQSHFSLRKPHKVAQYFYYCDRLHKKLSGHETDKVELFFNEYENLKTYFSYIKYSNIYKFYEDYRYQRAEKKFKYMVKFDLQSCFDSIYTHTISWATADGAEKVKILPGYHGSWLGDAFDSLMQSVNARETNGIVIGPEFSRIFAEIILQYVDKKVEIELLSSPKKDNLVHKSDYECYRYVDDYFLFYNNEKERDRFMECLTKWLKVFKLQISPSKTEEYERPFITKVTIAKQQLDALLHSIFSKPLWEEEGEDTIDDTELGEEITHKDYEILNKKLNLYLSANTTNAQIKTVVSECDIKYRDIANYLLEKISQKMDAFLNRYETGFRKLERIYNIDNLDIEVKKNAANQANKAQEKLTPLLIALIDIVFFIFNSNRQVNTTLKVQKIMNSIILYARRHGDFDTNLKIRFQTISKDIIFKKIQDEITLVLTTTGTHRNTLHESLYLLILAKELGTAYLFSPEVLESFIKKSEMQYNMFACVILLYYYSNHICYDGLKSELKDEILKKYKQVAETERKRNAELTILTADLMTCPFVEKEFKMNLLKLMGISESSDQKVILRFAKKQKYIFTRWTTFNLNKELQAKISQEVYS